ncbi:MAG: NAD(P)H-binding protein [Gammaproteobacteria bacterium]|nr:NAD(P)H-binding protein [Gammaproteobacteria bacterium]
MLQRRELIAAGIGLLTLRNTSAANQPPLAVFGATARSGRVIIAQALERGYDITGLARSPHKLDIDHPRLQLVKGDIRDVASLEAALDGDEVVICMIGYPTPKDPTQEIGEVDLYTVMARNLITAMTNQGNRRLIIASSTGVETRVGRDAAAPASANPTDMWRFNARYLYADMADMEEMLLGSSLDTVILRPGFMVEEPARNDLKFSTSGDTPPARVVTYEDFADFVLAQVDSNEFVGRPVSIYSDMIMDPAAELKKFQEKMRQQSQQPQ